MPWKVEHKPLENSNRDWAIMKKNKDGKWVINGRSTSKEKAQASVRARRAAEKESA